MAIDLSLETRAPRARALGRDLDDQWMERVIRAGVALAVLAVVAQLIAQIVDFTVYDLRVGALNSDVHASIFGIMSLAAEMAMAVAAAFRGMSSHQRARWFLLAGLSGALVAVRAALPDHVAAFAGPCALVFVLVWTLTSSDPARARDVARVALLLLAFSFVVHIVGLKIVHALGYGGNTWPYEIKCLLKHSAELSGWILLATGVLAGMRSSERARSIQLSRWRG